MDAFVMHRGTISLIELCLDLSKKKIKPTIKSVDAAVFCSKTHEILTESDLSNNGVPLFETQTIKFSCHRAEN